MASAASGAGDDSHLGSHAGKADELAVPAASTGSASDLSDNGSVHDKAGESSEDEGETVGDFLKDIEKAGKSL